MSKRPGENTPPRAEAEAKLAGAQPPPKVPALSARALLHELQVHRIELEMQNEELRRVQTELEESRDRYVELYEFAPVGYLTLGDTGLITETNLAGAALLGEERRRLIKRRFARFVLAEDSDRWQRFFSSALRHDGGKSCELAMQRGDGSRFYAKLDYARSAAADATPSLRVMLTDISERRQAAQAIRNSEQRFRAMVDQALVGIGQSDLEGHITFVNDYFSAITGYSPEELVGMRWQDLTHPDDLVQNASYYEQILGEARPPSLEKRYVRKNGEHVWVSVSASVLDSADGRARSVLAVVVDITKRKLGEDMLRKSSEEITDLYNHAPCGYHSLDKDGVIRRINDTELRWLGYTRDEVIGKRKWTDIISSASRKSFQENFPGFMKRGFVNDLEFEIIRKDGSVFTGLVNATAVYDDSGEYLMSRSTVQDITIRKRAEQELRIAAIAFQSQQAIMVTDAGGVILRVNDAFTRLTGYSAEEAIGRTPALLQSGVQDDNFYQHMWAALKHEHYWQGEIWNKRKDGSLYHELQTISGVMARDGSISHYIATLRDITEQKRLEKEFVERRNQMNDLLNLQVAAQTAAAIAHELNQPLLAISSYSGAASMMLQAEKPDLDKIRKAVEASEQQAHRAGRSIRELLEFLSIKEFNRESFDLNNEIHDILGIARSEHELKFNSILRLEQRLPLVYANRIHVHKVLLNLLHNCIDAMQQAGVPLPSITVTVRTVNDESVAELTLQDNGPGISKDDLQRVFEPFFTTKPGGIGMGLAVSRSLVEANGGQLWVDPQEGSGAIFHLTLPFAT